MKDLTSNVNKRAGFGRIRRGEWYAAGSGMLAEKKGSRHQGIKASRKENRLENPSIPRCLGALIPSLLAAAFCACAAPAAQVDQDADAPAAAEQSAAESVPQPPPLPPADPAVDGQAYSISDFVLQYVQEHPRHLSVEHLRQVPIELGQTTDGLVGPRTGVPPIILTLNDIAARPTEDFYATAVQQVLLTLRDELIDQGYLGVYVAPDPQQLTEAGSDRRPAGETELTILIQTGVVGELRTIASGERIDPEERIDHPAHSRIRQQSPIRPFDPEVSEEEGRLDLLRRDELERYLFFKSRHLGRRVDAAFSPGTEPGTVALDYLVTENKPLTFYVQLSNTGTKQTDRFRQRFGLYHTQLTNNDDILSIDFSTASFDDTNALSASYDAPFPNDRWRWKVFGSWSEFTADEVGFFGEDFTGEQWTLGAQIDWNFYQHREFFLDAIAGVRYLDAEVDNGLLGEGNEEFFIPYIGLEMERITEWMTTLGSVRLEYQGEFTSIDETELNLLGRTLPDDDWTALRWNLSHSMYLEPLLNYNAWSDPTTPRSSTLAHELRLSASGLHSFDNRLIAQEQMVAGGAYTVRGYEESVVAGDNVVMGTIEYRYHVPRGFPIESEPREFLGKPFRYAPQYVYGRPDWDLVLKAFVDAARVEQNDAFFFENDDTLIGVGVGFDLLYRRNINIRLDWGFALEETDNGVVDDGDDRVHVVATFLF